MPSKKPKFTASLGSTSENIVWVAFCVSVTAVPAMLSVVVRDAPVELIAIE